MVDDAVAAGDVMNAPHVALGLYVSDVDGAQVVQIDTSDATGRLRIYLNDATVWDDDPETGDPDGELSALRAEVVQLTAALAERPAGPAAVLDLVVMDLAGDDEAPETALVCPHPTCRHRHTAGPTVVDTATRWTDADELDHAAGTVSYFYDGSGDYHFDHYQCSGCSRTVNLPAGWREAS